MTNDQPIITLAQYLELAEQPMSFLFRGVTKSTYELIPSVARNWKKDTFPLPSLEKRMLSEFKRRSIPWLSFHPRNEWEWMMLAQHHHMPTRLLDWTANPLVALFFACFNHWDEQGAVFVLNGLNQLETDIIQDPFQIDRDYYILPPHISPRIAAQSAFFTVSCDPTKPLDCRSRILVQSDSKCSLLRQISRYGINAASLFPDLDGLALDLKREAENENLDHSCPV
ncbi:MAG: FRG domain-containing protein [Chloroflexi bacterium]|nr:FRG domain-containing protein [Chloroflexota bacterium]